LNFNLRKCHSSVCNSTDGGTEKLHPLTDNAPPRDAVNEEKLNCINDAHFRQEESRSISENVTWDQRKRFADAKISLPYSRFLGYDRSEEGLPQVNEDEAVIVRLIYRLFLEGQTPHSISKHLTELGLTSPGGKDNWQSGTIRNILFNEKYKGDALLQKKYTVYFLTKKQKVNEGEVPQYYVENSHPAIISSDVFDMVQQEIKRRKTMKNRHSSAGIFSSKIICGECGSSFGSKVWHSTSKYRRVILKSYLLLR